MRRWIAAFRAALRDRRPLRWLTSRLRRPPRTEAAVEKLDERVVAGLAAHRIPSVAQLRYLPRLLAPRERALAAGLLLLCFGSLTVFVLRQVGRFSAPTPVTGGSYVEGVMGNPEYVNPILTASNDADGDLLKLTFAGLTRWDRQHQIVPDLAERVDVDDRGTTYTVTLRPNLAWSDGEPLTVDDVLFTYGLIQDETFKSPLFAALRNITVERKDDRTVTFTLKEPLAPFPASLTVGLLPAHRWSDVQPTTARLNKLNLEPVGAGPYRVRELRYDDGGNVREYVLEPNPYARPLPRIATLTLRFYPDVTAAVEALRSKRVEALGFLQPDELGAVAAAPVTVRKLPLNRYVAIFYNQKRAALKDRAVREALTLALDRPSIASAATAGTAQVVEGPLLPGFPMAAQPEPWPFDRSEAEKRMDAAGWKRGDDGVRRKGNDALALTLTTSERSDYVQAAELVADAWKAIGVQVELNVVAGARITREVIRPRSYDAILYSHVAGPDPDPFPFWHSSQERDTGLNLAIFFRKDTDKLLEEGRRTRNPDERAAKYAEFSKLLREEVAATFLYQPAYLYALPKKLKGFDQTSLLDHTDRFSDIGNWYVKSRRRFR